MEYGVLLKIPWVDHVRNEEVIRKLHKDRELITNLKREILHIFGRKIKIDWICLGPCTLFRAAIDRHYGNCFQRSIEDGTIRRRSNTVIVVDNENLSECSGDSASEKLLL